MHVYGVVSTCGSFGGDEDAESPGSPDNSLLNSVGDSEALHKIGEVFFGFVTHRFFASAEDEFDLDLVAFAHELFRLILLEEKVMFLGSIAEADAFGLNFLLLGFGLLVLFRLVILEFAVVGDATDRRHGLGRDFDEVELMLASEGDTSGWRHDTLVFTVLIDNHDLWREDLFIDPIALFDDRLWFGAMVATTTHDELFGW